MLVTMFLNIIFMNIICKHFILERQCILNVHIYINNFLLEIILAVYILFECII